MLVRNSIYRATRETWPQRYLARDLLRYQDECRAMDASPQGYVHCESIALKYFRLDTLGRLLIWNCQICRAQMTDGRTPRNSMGDLELPSLGTQTII
jgi:hypothetical protein